MAESVNQDYISGVIQTLELSGTSTKEIPQTLCTKCPSAMWWVDKQGPKCFCRQTHSLTWTSSLTPTLFGCDGYELAMADYRRRQRRAGADMADDDDYPMPSDEGMPPFDEPT